MGDPVVISYFDEFEGPNEYRFLSNFYVGRPIDAFGRTYRSGEHMFQAFKAVNQQDHDRINAAGTPAEAKQAGKHYLHLRPDWERIKYDVMRLVLAAKFTPGREECALLLATGDALLVEGTTWGDRVWGVDLKAGRKKWADVDVKHPGGTPRDWDPGQPWQSSPGRNWLGTLLMARRAELVAALAGEQFKYGEVARFVS